MWLEDYSKVKLSQALGPSALLRMGPQDFHSLGLNPDCTCSLVSDIHSQGPEAGQVIPLSMSGAYGERGGAFTRTARELSQAKDRAYKAREFKDHNGTEHRDPLLRFHPATPTLENPKM